MKKKKVFHQLNKSTVIKALFIALIFILVQVIAGIFIYTLFANKVYETEIDPHGDKIKSVAIKLCENESAQTLDFDKEEDQDKLKESLGKYNDFSYYVIFRGSYGGQVVFSVPLIYEHNETFGFDYSKPQEIIKDGSHYVFAAAKLVDGDPNNYYYIAGINDFNYTHETMASMRAHLVAALVSSGAITLVAFLFYCYWSGAQTHAGKFEYHFKLDKDGKIVAPNYAFKKTFPSVGELQTSSLDKKKFNILRLRTGDGNQLLVARFGKTPNGETTVSASAVGNADSVLFSDSDGSTVEGSLSKLFYDFIKVGKRTLLGLMSIANLDQIKALFGKEMALNIQKVVIKKTKVRFPYVFDMDFGQIGVIFPDGRALDNLMTDLPDIYRNISQPLKMDDNLFTIELRAGFALCDSTMETLDFEYAMRAAEAARQRAIDTNIAEYLIYNESQKNIYTKYMIKYDIKQMLSEGAFEMEYQPQYNIHEERIEGFEALFRVKKTWNVNVDTFSFITYAERTGAMVQLGDFIFDTGMSFAKKLEGKNVSVSLNVSPVQLMQAGFTENFLKLYRKYDLKPGSICVEITESFLMTNFQETLRKLEILKKSGITVHLDDFGTEYSSLLYIKKLPISTIKIDKEFVKDVIKNKESQAIIKFITGIAKLLNLTTICEGVETTQEYDMLNYLGCDTIQGWLIGKSMKPEAALEIVDTFDYKSVVAASKSSGK